MKVYAIIPCGGTGKRFGGPIPKQYLKVNDKEILAYTLEIFEQNSLIDEIVISAEKKYFELIQNIKEKYSINKISIIVEGGKERQDSVFNALKSLNAKAEDIIVVHDAARPLLKQSTLFNALNLAKEYDNVIVAIKSKDTVAIGLNNVEGYIDRNKIWLVQTPQITRYGKIMKAMLKAYEDNFIGSDESSILHRIGEKIKFCEGDVFNFKITLEEDLKLFEGIISNIVMK